MIANAQNLRAAADALDHLLLGVSDLDRGIAWVEERVGIKAKVGGVHPGAGTRNALLSLGARHYLEIIAPDPAQSTYNFRVDIRSLTTPRLVNWAAVTNDIESIAAAARRAGFEAGTPSDGSRRTPSGEMLHWRSLSIPNKLGAGGVEPVPFFIQWAAGSRHPSQNSPSGCTLESLRFEHPDAAAFAAALKAFRIQGRISQGAAVRLTATLKTPKGTVEFS